MPRYSTAVTALGPDEIAQRSGVPIEGIRDLIREGILKPHADGSFGIADARRAMLIQGLLATGIPLEQLGASFRSGALTLQFMDDPSYSHFATFTGETFQQLSDRTGISVDLLMVIREAIGSAVPRPTDPVREDEMAIVPLIQVQMRAGFRPVVIERYLRVAGDSMRRVAETESNTFETEVLAPLFAAGKTTREIGPATNEVSRGLGEATDAALMAVHGAHQARSWTANIVNGFERMLAEAGLHSRLEHPPALCFLDITGYTRLTQERGDEAAAGLATTLARLVERASVRRGGKPIKWLGDGVMLYFTDPGPGVLAALDMVDGVGEAGLPPAHVGLHAGPVIFQQGDYYGQTVNLASRIADYARPGEVLVSQEVVDASADAAAFTDIGPVELKGVAGAMHLHSAHRA